MPELLRTLLRGYPIPQIPPSNSSFLKLSYGLDGQILKLGENPREDWCTQVRPEPEFCDSDESEAEEAGPE